MAVVQRAVRLQPLWRAQREHLYQRAVVAGASHGAVVASVLAVNLLLVALAALVAAGHGTCAIGGAAMATGLLLLRLARMGRAAP